MFSSQVAGRKVTVSHVTALPGFCVGQVIKLSFHSSGLTEEPDFPVEEQITCMFWHLELTKIWL